MMRLGRKRLKNHLAMIFVWRGNFQFLIFIRNIDKTNSRKYSQQKQIPMKKPCVGRCYIMKRDKMKVDNHLNKMIEDWKRKRSCVGVCYLVKVRMMKDKKFRREADTWNNDSNESESGEEDIIDYEEDEIEKEDNTMNTSTSSPIFSQILWNSYIKKTQKKS